jgi:hypothetical protein
MKFDLDSTHWGGKYDTITIIQQPLAPLSTSDKHVIWWPGLLGDLNYTVHNLENTTAEFSMEINTQKLKLLVSGQKQDMC